MVGVGGGGPNLRRGVHICLWPGRRIEILEYELILFRSSHFDYDMEKS